MSSIQSLIFQTRLGEFKLYSCLTLIYMHVCSPLFKLNSATEEKGRLVIIQCDLGNVDGDLIACARNRIYDLKAKADQQQTTHVLFIIHLSHQVVNSSFVGFQGDPWMSSHIDDLNTSTENTVSASDAHGLSISELFRGTSQGTVHRHADDTTSEVLSSESGDDDERWGFNILRDDEDDLEVQNVPPSIIVEDIENEDLFMEDKEGIKVYSVYHSI